MTDTAYREEYAKHCIHYHVSGNVRLVDTATGNVVAHYHDGTVILAQRHMTVFAGGVALRSLYDLIKTHEGVRKTVYYVVCEYVEVME